MGTLRDRLPTRLANRFPSIFEVKRARDLHAAVSVLLRVRNEAPHIHKFIESLQKQAMYDQVELIVLDSGSTDGTVNCLRDVNCTIYGIDSREFVFGETCNLLMSLSSSNVCFFFSGHVILESDDILEIAYHEIESGRAAAGYFRQVPNVYCGASVYDAAFLRRNFPAPGSRDGTNRKPASRFSNAASVVSRKAWESVWFPDVIASEDALWAREYLRIGDGDIRYFAELRVAHSHNESPESVANRVFVNAVACRSGIRGMLRAIVRFLPMMVTLSCSGGGVRDSARYSWAHLRGYLASAGIGSRRFDRSAAKKESL